MLPFRNKCGPNQRQRDFGALNCGALALTHANYIDAIVHMGLDFPDNFVSRIGRQIEHSVAALNTKRAVYRCRTVGNFNPDL